MTALHSFHNQFQDQYQQWRHAPDLLRSQTIFFIMGSQKSGTTWLQLSLNGHPEIASYGEGNMFVLDNLLGNAIKEFNEYQQHQIDGPIPKEPRYLQLMEHDAAFSLRCLFDMVLIRRINSPNIKCVGDKTPNYAVVCEPIKEKLYPDSKWIQIIRDGRDCVVSGWKNFIASTEAPYSKFPNIEAFIEYFVPEWRRNILAGKNFGKKYPSDYLEIRYENLLHTPEKVLTEICHFLNVDASQPNIEACQRAGDFKKFANGRNRGDEDPSSFFRKGVAGDWQNELTPSQVNRFIDLAGELSFELGYN